MNNNKNLNRKALEVTILNTSIITSFGTLRHTPISLDEARALVADGKAVSAVGHASTAQLLTTLLGVPVPVNRIQFAQTPQKLALVLKLNGRAPEGVILTLDEIKAIGYSFSIIEQLD